MALATKISKAIAKLEKQDKNDLYGSVITALAAEYDDVEDKAAVKAAVKAIKADGKAIKAGNKYYASALKASADAAYSKAKADEAFTATESGDKAALKDIKANIKAVKAAEKAGLGDDYIAAVKASADANNAKVFAQLTKQLKKGTIKDAEAVELAEALESIDADLTKAEVKALVQSLKKGQVDDAIAKAEEIASGSEGGEGGEDGEGGETGTPSSLTADSPKNIILTDKNDTVEAGEFLEGKNVIDQGGVDTLNATLKAPLTTATNIADVENINLKWDAFGTATVAADNISGDDVTITLSSEKTGFTGNAVVSGAGANTIVAGAGMTGKLTVSGGTDVTATGTNSKEVVVDGSTTRADNLSATVNAGANTTKIDVGATNGFDKVIVNGGAKTTAVVVNDSADVTVDAAAATKITVDGTAESDDKATLKLGVDATVVIGGTTQVENVTIEAVDGLTVDVAGSDLNSANKAKVTLKSDGAVTLKATSTELDGVTVTNNADSLNVEVDQSAATAGDDLSKVQANLITLTGSAAQALTFADGANVLVAKGTAIAGAATFVGSKATNSLNLTVLEDQTSVITAGTLKTLNLNVELDAADPDKKATLGGVSNAAQDVTLTSDDEVVITNVIAKNFDASESTGKLTATFANLTESVVGSQGANVLVMNAAAANQSVVTFDADDKVTLGAITGGETTLVLGNGNNEVVASAGVDTGSLSVNAGSGNDKVTVKAGATSATTDVVLELGDGNNTVDLTTVTAATATNVTIVTGSGNDTVKMSSNTFANDNISWTAGGGTNTLDLNGKDISLGTITLDGLTHILDSDGAGVVDGSLLNGKSYTIQGDGKIATQLDVSIATAGSYDFSGLVLDNTLTAGIGGLDITGNAGNDTIIGTAGADAIATGGGNDTITGGKGQDTITLGAGNDTVVIAAGDSLATYGGADIITYFKTAGTDVLKLGVAGSATNFLATDSDLGTGADDTAFDAALASANGGDLDGTVMYALYTNTNVTNNSEAYLFIDADLDGTADGAVRLAGLTASGTTLGSADIIA